MSDFGDGRYVVGRKDHRCVACYSIIPKGEDHYHYQGIYAGDWQNWRMHRECEGAYDKASREDGVYEFVSGDFPVPERISALMKGILTPAIAPESAESRQKQEESRP
jgi:hypothetical protein